MCYLLVVAGVRCLHLWYSLIMDTLDGWAIFVKASGFI